MNHASQAVVASGIRVCREIRGSLHSAEELLGSQFGKGFVNLRCGERGELWVVGFGLSEVEGERLRLRVGKAYLCWEGQAVS